MNRLIQYFRLVLTCIVSANSVSQRFFHCFSAEMCDTKCQAFVFLKIDVFSSWIRQRCSCCVGAFRETRQNRRVTLPPPRPAVSRGHVSVEICRSDVEATNLQSHWIVSRKSLDRTAGCVCVCVCVCVERNVSSLGREYHCPRQMCLTSYMWGGGEHCGGGLCVSWGDECVGAMLVG